MTDVFDDGRLAVVERQIDEWLAGFRVENPAIEAIDRGDGDERRWYVRMHGEAKEYITVWLTLGQRTLQYEAYVMPAPGEHVAEVYEQVLRRNERTVGAHFAIGGEDAIFLRGDLPLGRTLRVRAGVPRQLRQVVTVGHLGAGAGQRRVPHGNVDRALAVAGVRPPEDVGRPLDGPRGVDHRGIRPAAQSRRPRQVEGVQRQPPGGDGRSSASLGIAPAWNAGKPAAIWACRPHAMRSRPRAAGPRIWT